MSVSMIAPKCTHCQRKISYGSSTLKCRICKIQIHEQCRANLKSNCICQEHILNSRRALTEVKIVLQFFFCENFIQKTPKIEILDKNRNFGQKSKFWPKLEILDKNRNMESQKTHKRKSWSKIVVNFFCWNRNCC